MFGNSNIFVNGINISWINLETMLPLKTLKYLVEDVARNIESTLSKVSLFEGWQILQNDAKIKTYI